MARRITYKPMTESDPQSTQVGPHRFEAGKAVEVPDAVYEKLSQNPWFKGDKQAAERLTTGGGVSAGPSSGIDSSVLVAPPPGSGMKYSETSAMTAAGLVATDAVSDTDLVDNANSVEDPKEAKKAGRVANKG